MTPRLLQFGRLGRPPVERSGDDVVATRPAVRWLRHFLRPSPPYSFFFAFLVETAGTVISSPATMWIDLGTSGLWGRRATGRQARSRSNSSPRQAILRPSTVDSTGWMLNLPSLVIDDSVENSHTLQRLWRAPLLMLIQSSWRWLLSPFTGRRIHEPRPPIRPGRFTAALPYILAIANGPPVGRKVHIRPGAEALWSQPCFILDPSRLGALPPRAGRSNHLLNSAPAQGRGEQIKK
ncbi:hypothetical protein VTN02DRAFT_2081 [Thermoascus thermophilus]